MAAAYTQQMANACRNGLKKCAEYYALREVYAKAGLTWDNIDKDVEDQQATFQQVLDDYNAQKLQTG